MIFNYLYRSLLLLFMVSMMNSCVEPYEFSNETYENVLVVNARLTNELKRHEVNLTRSYPLEEEESIPEVNATVRVFDDAQNQFLFQEASPGRYVAVEEFRALGNREYTLEIRTQDGNLFTSDPVILAPGGEIDELQPIRTVHEEEVGVAIQLSSFNSDESSKYYKFEYEETFKIVSPYRHDRDLVVRDGNFVEVPKTKEETTCYRTDDSKEIILANTTNLAENNLNKFLVKFISRENPILARRYSALVKQYSLTREAFAYYETLNKLSGSESLFSQNQPGFVQGNIFSPDNPENRVVGFFHASSVSERRIFFSFEDFFDPFQGRPELVECNVANPSIGPPPSRADNLKDLLKRGKVKYLGRTIPQSASEGPYLVVEAECVDCTLLGTNVEPEFWEE